MIGYLDIDIKNNIYNNSKTPVNNVHAVTCVLTTLAVTAEERRGTRKGRSYHP
jgi:hypothetical protein